MANWLLQCSPAVWDVFAWWEDEDGELDRWTVARHLDDIRAGHRFAFWVGGREAGVYAVGQVKEGPAPVSPPRGGYWRRPPKGPVHMVKLATSRYLFDAPMRKSELLEDSDFRDALVVRMPRTANPIALTDRQWSAIQRRLPRGRGVHARPVVASGEIAITVRSLGSVVEISSVAPSSVERVREHREAAMLKRYEKSLERSLVVKTAKLPSGERLVVDAFDQVTGRLIEAKASGSRQDVRMAIGQLLDYRRHISPKAQMAVLLAERPTEDLLELLRSLKIAVVVERSKGRFVEV